MSSTIFFAVRWNCKSHNLIVAFIRRNGRVDAISLRLRYKSYHKFLINRCICLNEAFNRSSIVETTVYASSVAETMLPINGRVLNQWISTAKTHCPTSKSGLAKKIKIKGKPFLQFLEERSVLGSVQ